MEGTTAGRPDVPEAAAVPDLAVMRAVGDRRTTRFYEPDRSVGRPARAFGPVRMAGLLFGSAGRRREGSALLGGGALASLALSGYELTHRRANSARTASAPRRRRAATVRTRAIGPAGVCAPARLLPSLLHRPVNDSKPRIKA